MTPLLRKKNKHSARSVQRHPPPLVPAMMKDIGKLTNQYASEKVKENSISINAGQVVAEKRKKLTETSKRRLSELDKKRDINSK